MGKQQKMPNLDGYPTTQRYEKAGSVALPQSANDPAYINTPIRSENAPSFALPSPLEQALKVYELQKLLDYYDGWCVRNGRPRPASYEGNPAPKGKMAGGGLGFRHTEQYLHVWFTEINGLTDETRTHGIPQYKRCGLEYFCRIQAGEGEGHTLEDIGRQMARVDQMALKYPKRIKSQIIQAMSEAGYIAYYTDCVQSIYATEKRISDLRRRNRYSDVIIRPSRFPKVELER